MEEPADGVLGGVSFPQNLWRRDRRLCEAIAIRRGVPGAGPVVYILGMLLAWWLPETRGKPLPE
jgi:hypothetical protein